MMTTLNLLREFSREVADARKVADTVAAHNNRERGTSLTAHHDRLFGHNEWLWVSWVADERGHAIACYWARSSNLDTLED
ncbi:hypothetical protein [Streptomyces sp. cg35]|uniref:hypothetical protein n=1 Tax=Streptomyces sp. cg35 TaxID=3421650 RepID=UPI003D178779